MNESLTANAGPHQRQAALFTGTIFIGAVLLFWIQPLFTKMALPLLGGSPSVWNTAMVFFQAMLLAGYAYAHGLARWFGVRGQVVVHAILLAAAALALPVGIADGWHPDAATPPALWLLGLLFVSLGAPFFVLAATAPLLQRWFSLGRHPQAHDPYFLYAASNAGSVAVLLAFPFILEPLLATGAQAILWAFGFALLAVSIVACGASLWRLARAPVVVDADDAKVAADGPQKAAEAGHPARVHRLARQEVDDGCGPGESGARPSSESIVSWRQRAAWVAYSAVPSALLLGVTAHISTDIASAPLLWVLPLALYLLSFVNAFARKPLVPQWFAGRAMAFAIVLLAAVFLWREPAGVYLPLHLGAFFCMALACHGELASRRPAAGALTEFYLFLSLGGLIGGVFVALVAPVVFDSVLEYPLCIVFAAALLPRRRNASATPGAPVERGQSNRMAEPGAPVADSVQGTLIARRLGWGRAFGVERGDLVLAAVIAVATLGAGAIFDWFDWFGLPLPRIAYGGLLAVLAVFALSRQLRPPAFALCIAALLAGAVHPPWGDSGVWTGRSFFGVYKVTEREEPPVRSLVHGTTNHGGQWMPGGGVIKPTTYHTDASPAVDVIRALRDRSAALRIGLVGLGTGALAYHRQARDQWRYFEIDPMIEWLAVHSGYFGMISRHDPGATIVPGDARLTLAREPNGFFDLIILDVFTSDAIPIHLLTQEAFVLYMRKLRPGGLLVFHISNRLLDLRPVVAGAVADLGYAARLGHLRQIDKAVDPTATPSQWVAVAVEESNLAALELGENWTPLNLAEQRRWRDDFSSLAGSILWRGPYGAASD